MLKILSLCCFSVFMFLTSLSHAEQTSLNQQSFSIDYELPPNIPQIFSNYVFWTIEANCTLATEDQSITLNIVALAKQGKINLIPISSGQTLQLTLTSNENLRISADPGAKVEITNLGEHVVTAHCTTS
jgi:hypothetical protein